MKVSVIMATYNHAKTIEKALKSVLLQITDFDFEVIVVNDGSTDRTKDILKNFTNITVVNSPHRGVMKTYQTGFFLARGEYIAILDGDDYWLTRMKLQRQVDFMDMYAQYGLCVTKVFTDNGTDLIPTKQDIGKINKGLTYDNLLKGNAFIHAQSYLIRKSYFDKFIDFSRFMKFYTWDYPIVLELIRHTNFICLNFHSAVFVKGKESVTQTRSRAKRLKYLLNQYGVKLYFISRYGCKLSTAFYLIYVFIRGVYSVIFKRWYK